jgi:hypothetical protein
MGSALEKDVMAKRGPTAEPLEDRNSVMSEFGATSCFLPCCNWTHLLPHNFAALQRRQWWSLGMINTTICLDRQWQSQEQTAIDLQDIPWWFKSALPKADPWNVHDGRWKPLSCQTGLVRVYRGIKKADAHGARSKGPLPLQYDRYNLRAAIKVQVSKVARLDR